MFQNPVLEASSGMDTSPIIFLLYYYDDGIRARPGGRRRRWRRRNNSVSPAKPHSQGAQEPNNPVTVAPHSDMGAAEVEVYGDDAHLQTRIGSIPSPRRPASFGGHEEEEDDTSPWLNLIRVTRPRTLRQAVLASVAASPLRLLSCT